MMPLIIERLYAWITEDDNGQQGVIGWINPNGMSLPLVGADMARMESFRDYVYDLAQQHNKKIFLYEIFYYRRRLAKILLPTINDSF